MEEQKSDSVSRWDRRRARTYERLLEAGERLFRLNGFDATTVEEVAAAADVAKGTFFNYFNSKEALLGRVLYARLHSVFQSSQSPDASPEDQIWDLLVSARQELRPYVHLFRQMFAYALSHPGIPAQGNNDRMLAEALAQVVREGQAQGVFHPQLDATVAGGLIATLFFRLCVLECVYGECAKAEDRPAAVHIVPGERAETDFCWESQMQAGLRIIYQGLKGK
ncbi:MAG: TetR/AcrR family transcriptional regulator [Anaerolineae bacterium]|nr:TetR/AcrR family transcriptional regulator [Anaerolineae bacterium]